MAENLTEQSEGLKSLLKVLELRINKFTPAQGDTPFYESTPVDYKHIGKLDSLAKKLAEFGIQSEINQDASTPRLKILSGFEKLESLNVVYDIPPWLDRVGKTTEGVAPDSGRRF